MDFSSRLRADDLLVLLAVARTGRFSRAALQLGLDHTTISRRIAALEESLGGRVLLQSSSGWELSPLGHKALEAAGGIESAISSLTNPESDSIEGTVRMSATDGFSAYIAAPAIAALRGAHPRLSVEILTSTRRALQRDSGLDIEVVVGRPETSRARSVELGVYSLGMYASRDYLARAGTPTTREDLITHSLVYFVDSMLRVDALDLPRRLVPEMSDALTSTNVFIHVQATLAGAGVGLLPCFMADRHAGLVRLLPHEFNETLPYWMVVRRDSMSIPAVVAVADALQQQTAGYRRELAGGFGSASAVPVTVPEHFGPRRNPRYGQPG